MLFRSEYGYVETLPDKSVDPERGYPLQCFRDERGAIKPTIPLNYHVQSTAMWWMCQAMIRTYSLLDWYNRSKYQLSTAQLIEEHRKGNRSKQGYFLILQVHDELVFEIKKSKLKAVFEGIKENMEHILPEKETHGVPIIVEASSGENWGELQKVNE